MWTEFPEMPQKTGKYIVAHRGHVVVLHYLANDKDWHAHNRLGWVNGDPREFGATHWMEYEGPPPATQVRTGFRELRAGDLIRFTHDRVYSGVKNPRRRVTKWKFDWRTFKWYAKEGHWETDRKDISVKRDQVATIVDCTRSGWDYTYYVEIDGWKITLNKERGREFDPVNPTKFHWYAEDRGESVVGEG